ncbi:uncharacterized protein LOC132202879 isoform X2 [Neocloeon triangulifer]|uniref:uncharacterized protein LOC132202879 isoform X2 n=1 Tax=Neocloeon triangulifer TaxID=2078957 RepID=UPI00286F2385|nr:uncharacterized protein LOC132202879 isoform X2 [Neocloeon triangulifer]
MSRFVPVVEQTTPTNNADSSNSSEEELDLSNIPKNTILCNPSRAVLQRVLKKEDKREASNRNRLVNLVSDSSDSQEDEPPQENVRRRQEAREDGAGPSRVQQVHFTAEDEDREEPDLDDSNWPEGLQNEQEDDHQEDDSLQVPNFRERRAARQTCSPATLKLLLESERESKLCVICMEVEKCVMLMPCRHICMCQLCSATIASTSSTCPVCRTVFEEAIEGFM